MKNSKSNLVKINVLLIFIILLITLTFGCTKTNPGNDFDNNTTKTLTSNSSPQEIYVHANSNGTYSIQEIVVKKGVLVRIHFTADKSAGCGKSFVIYGMQLPAVVSKNGEEALVQFTPENIGTYEYSCAMRMWKIGKILVIE